MRNDNGKRTVIQSCALRGRDKTNPKYRGKANANFVQMLEIGGGISNSLTTVAKDSMVIEFRGQALTKCGKDFLVMEEPNIRIRKLTPKECFRLMAFDDKDYEAVKDAGVSNSQTYKQAGNSICTNVLEAIFGQMFEGKEENYKRWDTLNLPNIHPAKSVNEEQSAE